ncbi:MAG: hypothetical protein HUU20_25540 [Pirellulales bacterium]|nr:hypothetical protein [Pirellulales bacterium]
MWKELVDGAADELERSAAATLVYLTWLEIRALIELEEARADLDPLFPTLVDPERLMAQHLQLLTAKQRNSELLAKLRFAREKSACRQSAATNHPSSTFLGSPLRPLRCVPSALSDTVPETQPSKVDSPAPEDAEEQYRPVQLPSREVQGAPRRQSDPEQDHTHPPNVSLKTEQDVAGRHTSGPDASIRQLDAQKVREEPGTPVSSSSDPRGPPCHEGEQHHDAATACRLSSPPTPTTQSGFHPSQR